MGADHDDGAAPTSAPSRARAGVVSSALISSVFLQQQPVFPGISEFVLHRIYFLIEARQPKHHCLYLSRKCLASLTASLLGRQPTIQPIVSRASWGGTTHTGDGMPARCAPSSARGGVISVSIWIVCKKTLT